ncbi:Transcription regulator of multidrug efflux pump protein [Minicystis rosea]|nr:Transcription regulator of multidrug efflux pump protein [Minicystis rosea]
MIHHGGVKRKDETKARDILAATLHEVAEHGLAALSIEAVARRAGVATGTVYVYYKSKEALLEALYLDAKRALAGAVFRDEGLPVRPTFLKMCTAYLDYFVAHRAEMIFMEQLYNAPFLSAETRAAAELGVKPLHALLERGRREMLLKDLDDQVMIAFLQGALQGLALLVAKEPAAKRATRREQIARLCWDALKA